ncbi:hypothetical protein GCWU000324_00919 [Kingella oralis ATCC 51147]|uniref:Uncharacterized protein n=1 Tax=Kingella oralis ATCC 51147 TaxID=629741 RepID=C4GFK3_9NEIS|nr:hypothetical protein GCWU000324_00919 [Kingella oralis ATCC 51147]
MSSFQAASSRKNHTPPPIPLFRQPETSPASHFPLKYTSDKNP